MSFQTDAGKHLQPSPQSTGVTTSVPTARSATATLTPAAPTTTSWNATSSVAGQSAAAQPARGVGQLTWAAPSTELPAVSVRPRTPEPRLRQLMGVCGWAAVLGGIGLVIAIRGLFGVITGNPPGWFVPAAMSVGLAGIGITVTAYVSVHRRRLPWALLSLATLLLVATMIITASAF